MLKNNLVLKIEGVSHDGRGVGRVQGKIIFVENAIPGDEVEVVIVEENAQFDVGRLVRILVDSEDRVSPFCTLYQVCGGCQLQHQSIQAQREWKAKNFFNALNKALDMRKCVVESPLLGQDMQYRRRARFVWGRNKEDKQPRLGFRAKSSNEIIDVEHCPILEPALNESLAQNRTAYLDTASRNLREVTVVASDALVLWSKSPEGEELEAQGQYSIQGLTLNFPAAGFIQVNPALNEQMVVQALAWLNLTPEDRVLDLFCGVGNFTLPMARKVKQVVGVEGEANLVAIATENALANALVNALFFKTNLFEDMTRVQWFHGERYDKVLLDPGRLGAQLVCENMGKLSPKVIVYVSCNAATLVRDVKILAKQGYQIKKANMIDMFPHTTHTEVMVQLVKTNKVKSTNKRKVFKL